MILKSLYGLVALMVLWGCAHKQLDPAGEFNLVKKETEHRCGAYYVIDNKKPGKERTDEKTN